MSKIEEYYDIRLAKETDIDTIMQFVKTEWNENHILANDKAFFKYEYCYENAVNVMLAVDKNTEKIACMQGFIRFSKVTEERKKTYIAGALLKAAPSGRVPFVGVETQKKLLSLPFVENFVGNGLNTGTSLVLAQKVFRRNTGKLNHHYMLSEQKEYVVADIKEKVPQTIKEHKQYHLKAYASAEDLFSSLRKDISEYETNICKKDEWYIKRRYFEYPIYKYKVYGIQKEDGMSDGIIVCREQKQFQRKILRIVDFIGMSEDFAHLGRAFNDIIQENDYEYIDFYETGIKREYIKNAGFTTVRDGDVNIIPNYFEPYVRQNIDIWWESPFEHPVMFKADGDQDRPCRRNEINE